LALADFLPCGRPAPLRGPPWVGLVVILIFKQDLVWLVYLSS
jgi:hypothetical protein